MPRKSVVSNPFGDSSDESDEDFNPFAPKKAKETDPEPIQVPKPLVTSAKQTPSKPLRKVPSNPFDDDDEEDAPTKTDKGGDNFKAAVTVTPAKSKPKPKSVRPASRILSPNTADTKAKNNVMIDFGKSSNPFDNDGTEDIFAPSSSRTPVQKSKHTRSKTTGNMNLDAFGAAASNAGAGQVVSTAKSTSKHAKSKTTNPFEFDANFQETATDDANAKPKGGVKKSLFARRKVGKDKDVNKNGELTPIVSTMDQDDSKPKPKPNSSMNGNHAKLSKSQHGDKKVAFDPTVKTKVARPGLLASQGRSKSESSVSGNPSAEKEPTKGGWLRGGNKVAAVSSYIDEQNLNRSPKKLKKKNMAVATKKVGDSSNSAKKKKKKNVFVQCWPYDDYHKDQERYYESIQERDGPMKGNGSPRLRKKGVDADGYTSGSDDDIMREQRKQELNGFTNENMFDRPDNLPSIKEAVQNLSLFDFEQTAEQRAISIVSTWLFDAGLIDELLINGANGYRASLPNAASMAQSASIASVKSSEGVEVGAHGFPLEGGLKIDKETEKLRTSTQRELTLINTRLNDGVAASGSEVQELVNAVSATKNELGRLRELVTYISGGYKKDGKSDSKDRLLLADYPRLKRAINARRNIFRCFRELEFFSQIPMTCDRLREELHQGEWTANEWNSIRDVCMEHVELEILLVEAEAGMKAWLDDEDDGGDDESSMPSIRSNKSLKRSWKGRHQASLLAGNHQVVDDFLSQHVKNVWELGLEIRMRILSGVGSAFDLALQNPAGMVALVEAVEVYERAADEYKASRFDDGDSVSSDKNSLRFTDMRAAALAQLYQDFELRGLEIFRAIHMQAADLAEEDNALNHQFNAVLRAATELVTEIDVVKNQMSPCFAPHWHVEMLWSSCVAHVCSNQIIQQIGGPDGQNLPDLTVTQLLDLVAWVEFFRETIEEAFPSIGSIQDTKKTYFDERPDLFAGNEKTVNMENAKDSLAWVNNMLWNVHRLAQDEFLLRTRSQTDEWVKKVYNTSHETNQTREGRLVTSLCEDVFSLAGVQLRTIRERLTRKSDALVMAVCLIFSQLRGMQLSSRNKFLVDLESCCAAANDFQRMSEQVEDVVQEIIDHSELPDQSIQMLEDGCGALVSIYSGDAVFAAQKAHCFIFEPIWEAISDDLFGPKWEGELTHNELAMTLTRTLVSKVASDKTRF